MDIVLTQISQKLGKSLHLHSYMHISKMDDIQELISHIPTRILALTETWLEEDQVDSVNLPGCNFVHKSRSNGCGGGVFFY